MNWTDASSTLIVSSFFGKSTTAKIGVAACAQMCQICPVGIGEGMDTSVAAARARNNQPMIEAICLAAEVERSEWRSVQHGRRKQSPLWAFCRELRQEPKLHDLEDKAALAKVRDALRQSGTSLDALWPDCDDPAIDFLAAWRHTDKIGSFAAALRAADSEPERIAHTISIGYSRFCGLCAQLQRRKGCEPIILSVEAFASALGVDRRTISRYKQQAEVDGLLVLVAPAEHRAHSAARYRYAAA